MSGYLYKKRQNRTLIKSSHFPYRKRESQKIRNVALIGVGGNVGNTLRRFKRLLTYINREPRLKLLATSTILKNPPFGYLEQADFFNTLILLETPLSAMELLHLLQRIEQHFGRQRLFKNAPRTLDLDIIAFNKEKIKKIPKLIVPHPYYKERESVTAPLRSLKGVKWLKRAL